MVQIIQERKKPSFSERLNVGVGRGLEMGSQLMQQQQAQKQMQQENEQLKALTGVDFSGIQDPKIRQAAVGELLKRQGKQELFGQKEQFLNQILGQGRQQQQANQEPQEMQSFQQEFDPSQISDADIARAASMDPVLGRELRAAKDSALRDKRAQEKFQLQKEKSSPEYQRQQHIESSQAQADVKYNQNLQELSRQHELKEQTLNRLEALNKKGVTGKPYEKFLEKAGLISLTSDGRREFAADVKNLITDIRSILGGQFSQAEFMTILNAYPSADFSKNANAAIIKNLKEFQDIKTKEVEIARELKKENGGKIPFDFQSKVNEKVQEYVQTKLPSIKENTRKIMNEEYGIPEGFTLMFDPQGNEMSVPESDVANLLEMGATLP